MVYRSLFLPWTSPVSLDAGDSVRLRLRADFTGSNYLWTWETLIGAHAKAPDKAHFRQSTFWGSPLAPERLRKRDSSRRPALTLDGRIDALILGAMNGTATVDEIAQTLMASFPDRFSSLAEALGRVGDLVETYGRSDGGPETTR